ncbi:hypothetical protein OIO90_002670 [Microbotryomycetes sp. JL221]|nr:hypothetical protein OIO90_002670 [Microbotryomycetes sp. JL221]
MLASIVTLLVVPLTVVIAQEQALFDRRRATDASDYPERFESGPEALPAWLDKLDVVREQGLIPSTEPSSSSGSYPMSDPEEVCAAVEGCFGQGSLADVADAPPGDWIATFDDGPQPASSTLYEFLSQRGLKLTHFLIGGNVLAFSEEFEELVAQGGHLGVHTWSHPYLTTLTDEQVVGELGWTMQIIYDRTGLLPSFWRPPFGDIDNRVRALARYVFNLQPAAIWNQDTNDWCLSEGVGSSCGSDGPTTDEELRDTINELASGPKTPGILLLEHESTDRAVDAFVRTLQVVQANGWTVKTLADSLEQPWYQVGTNVSANTVDVATSSLRSPASQTTSIRRPVVHPIVEETSEGELTATKTRSRSRHVSDNDSDQISTFDEPTRIDTRPVVYVTETVATVRRRYQRSTLGMDQDLPHETHRTVAIETEEGLHERSTRFEESRSNERIQSVVNSRGHKVKTSVLASLTVSVPIMFMCFQI